VSSNKKTPEKAVTENNVSNTQKLPWSLVISWGATALVVVLLLLVLFNKLPLSGAEGSSAGNAAITPIAIDMPGINSSGAGSAVSLVRNPNMDTTIPENSRSDVSIYTVEAGDSIFSIASKFGLKPESVLWANDDYFGGDPTVALSIGVQLNIPPTDGVLYKWKEGDVLEKVADEYDASEIKILSWPSNNLDVSNPTFKPDTYVMIPGGVGTIESWIQEVAYSPRSGVTQTIEGPGGCAISGGYGAIGSTAFIWPSAQHELSGFDFSSYHKGIDIAAYVGDPVWASDSGTVVYAGWNNSGYGNLVMIDHNNGYQTVYGHLSVVYVTCGENIAQGVAIGAAGSTGKSTGPHLHFEIRKNGFWINPWYVLN
jgi:murein DD-endopeptidase MepM/ murein hydrolase activator NlpD